ncbi:MAG: hypothetical protein HYY84_06010 [Deltaproteobacteria bacterium]|nr:hypothetical protein [Deltaproteobacteria bacterium]
MKQRRSWFLGALRVGAVAVCSCISDFGGDESGRIVAYLESSDKGVETRLPGSHRWEPATTGMALVDGQSVRTAPGSTARISFASGSVWTIAEETTVTLLREVREDSPAISLELGVVRPSGPISR